MPVIYNKFTYQKHDNENYQGGVFTFLKWPYAEMMQ